MAQVTLVSLYGKKKSALAALIAHCQRLVINAAGAAFAPYDILQIHATIIGLEARADSPGCNANFAEYRGRDAIMDFDGFFTCLRECRQIPFEVQIGGFANGDYPFISRRKAPYERSFSVQGDKVVVMGWPVRIEPSQIPAFPAVEMTRQARIYPPTLDTLRRSAQQFGILHGYHITPADIDNDFFFRIGTLDPKRLNPAGTIALEDHVRSYLSNQLPLIFEISLDDISVAAYEDDRLPITSTRAWSLADPGVTGDFVAGLYA